MHQRTGRRAGPGESFFFPAGEPGTLEGVAPER